MRAVTDEELKVLSMQILEDVAAFCDAHKVQYYLVCGTALGAVRHNGFIPWDDDIDIGMPRPDYERFLSEYTSLRYCLSTHKTDKNYPYAFAKVCDPRTVLIENIEHPCALGVYIDVFPIDGLPKDEKARQKHLKRIKWDLRILSWKRISRAKKVGAFHKAVQVAAKAVLSPIPVSSLVERLDSDAKRFAYENSEYVGHLTTVAVWGNDVKQKQVFENPVKHKFETGEFWLPGSYKEYLTLEYGDFMKLPPIEKQVKKHDFTVCWKDGQPEENNG